MSECRLKRRGERKNNVGMPLIDGVIKERERKGYKDGKLRQAKESDVKWESVSSK